MDKKKQPPPSCLLTKTETATATMWAAHSQREKDDTWGVDACERLVSFPTGSLVENWKEEEKEEIDAKPSSLTKNAATSTSRKGQNKNKRRHKKSGHTKNMGTEISKFNRSTPHCERFVSVPLGSRAENWQEEEKEEIDANTSLLVRVAATPTRRKKKHKKKRGHKTSGRGRNTEKEIFKCNQPTPHCDSVQDRKQQWAIRGQMATRVAHRDKEIDGQSCNTENLDSQTRPGAYPVSPSFVGENPVTSTRRMGVQDAECMEQFAATVIVKAVFKETHPWGLCVAMVVVSGLVLVGTVFLVQFVIGRRQPE